jgi:tRNA (mo5U34)-methyltransferase
LHYDVLARRCRRGYHLPLDIKEVARRAEIFNSRLDEIKDEIKAKTQVAFPWYPYASLGNLIFLDRLLTGGRRDFLRLAGEAPVLDIGCGDGAVSFFLESLGCRVEAVDSPATNINEMQGVRKLREALGSRVQVHSMDLDRQFSLPHDRYGLVLLFGVLYHLKNPFHVLETLSHHARYCALSTRVARWTPGRKIRMETAPVAYLVGESELNADRTNYWIFSEAGLKRILERTGWEVLDFCTSGSQDSDPVSASGDERAFCLLGSRIAGRLGPAQLLEGWHAMEPGQWRWTEREFSILASAPASRRGTLRLQFVVSAPLLDSLGALTLSASANGVPLTAQTYEEPGPQVYLRALPESALAASDVRIQFRLDKALAPGPHDERELGLIVTQVEVS